MLRDEFLCLREGDVRALHRPMSCRTPRRCGSGDGERAPACGGRIEASLKGLKGLGLGGVSLGGWLCLEDRKTESSACVSSCARVPSLVCFLAGLVLFHGQRQKLGLVGIMTFSLRAAGSG